MAERTEQRDLLVGPPLGKLENTHVRCLDGAGSASVLAPDRITTVSHNIRDFTVILPGIALIVGSSGRLSSEMSNTPNEVSRLGEGREQQSQRSGQRDGLLITCEHRMAWHLR
jgi:hypothetical protein